MVFENHDVHYGQVSLIYTLQVLIHYNTFLVPSWANTLHLITYNATLAVLFSGVHLSKLVKMF